MSQDIKGGYRFHYKIFVNLPIAIDNKYTFYSL